jgi:hypothetical protein
LINKKPEMMNAFEKATKKRPAASPDTKTMPLSQRMTRARAGESSPDRESAHPNWRPSRPEDRPTTKTAPQTTTVAPRKTASGVVEEARLTKAREAEQRRRADAKNPVPARTTPVLLLAPEDIQAILESWIRIRTEQGRFFPTNWNSEQLTRLVHHQVETNGWTWGISSFDAANEWLAANGYFETERHHRGQQAPKEFPVYQPPKAQVEPTRSGSSSVYIRRDETCIAEARKMDFDTLKKQATATYKPEAR